MPGRAGSRGNSPLAGPDPIGPAGFRGEGEKLIQIKYSRLRGSQTPWYESFLRIITRTHLNHSLYLR